MKLSLICTALLCCLVKSAIWTDLVSHTCDSNLNYLPSSPFSQSVDTRYLFTMMEIYSEMARDRVECKCPTISEQEFQRRWIPGPAAILNILGDTQTNEVDSCDPNQFAWTFQQLTNNPLIKTIELDLPDSCTSESWANSETCFIRFDIEEASGVNLLLAVEPCPGSYVPKVTLSCEGSVCENMLAPCESDSECGDQLICNTIDLPIEDVEADLLEFLENAGYIGTAEKLCYALNDLIDDTMNYWGSWFDRPAKPEWNTVGVCFPNVTQDNFDISGCDYYQRTCFDEDGCAASNCIGDFYIDSVCPDIAQSIRDSTCNETDVCNEVCNDIPCPDGKVCGDVYDQNSDSIICAAEGLTIDVGSNCEDAFIGDQFCDDDCLKAKYNWDGGDCAGKYNEIYYAPFGSSVSEPTTTLFPAGNNDLYVIDVSAGESIGQITLDPSVVSGGFLEGQIRVDWDNTYLNKDDFPVDIIVFSGPVEITVAQVSSDYYYPFNDLFPLILESRISADASKIELHFTEFSDDYRRPWKTTPEHCVTSCPELLSEWDGSKNVETSINPPAIEFGSSGRTVVPIVGSTCDAEFYWWRQEKYGSSYTIPFIKNVLEFAANTVEKFVSCRSNLLTEKDIQARFMPWTLPFLLNLMTDHDVDLGPDISDPIQKILEDSKKKRYNPTETDTGSDTEPNTAEASTFSSLFVVPSACSLESWRSTGKCALKFSDLTSLLFVDIELAFQMQDCGSGMFPRMGIDCIGAACDPIVRPNFCSTDNDCPGKTICIDIVEKLLESVNDTEEVYDPISQLFYADTSQCEGGNSPDGPCVYNGAFKRDLRTVFKVLANEPSDGLEELKVCWLDIERIIDTEHLEKWGENRIVEEELSDGRTTITLSGLKVDDNPIDLPPGGGPVIGNPSDNSDNSENDSGSINLVVSFSLVSFLAAFFF